MHTHTHTHITFEHNISILEEKPAEMVIPIDGGKIPQLGMATEHALWSSTKSAHLFLAARNKQMLWTVKTIYKDNGRV